MTTCAQPAAAEPSRTGTATPAGSPRPRRPRLQVRPRGRVPRCLPLGPTSVAAAPAPGPGAPGEQPVGAGPAGRGAGGDPAGAVPRPGQRGPGQPAGPGEQAVLQRLRPAGRPGQGRAARADRGFLPQLRHPVLVQPEAGAGDLVAGQYEVLGCLAHGGLGWIYLARDRNVSDRWVVLKGLLNTGDADAMAAPWPSASSWPRSSTRTSCGSTTSCSMRTGGRGSRPGTS